ncbi:MAG: hypothetical protein QOG52_2156 [Frankiaceae bacterium]|nr:hypothetical protein [Frankiaceae bacterium]
MHRVPRTVVGVVAAVALLSVSSPAPASASSSSRALCTSKSFSCLTGSGFHGQSAWGSWGPGHNCVSYAAYRLKKNGVLDPWSSAAPDASKWDEEARSAGVRVDHVPAVGAIAQWDVGTYGHIAYVERVTAQYIDISEDSYINDSSGVSSVRRLSRTGRDFATADFLHFHVKPAHR